MVENIDRIDQYVEGHDAVAVQQDGLRRDAIERCLERICEAAVRLGPEADSLLPGHPWNDIRGMGNRLRHAYDRIDFSVVWNVLTQRLPVLKRDVLAALRKLRNDDPDEVI